MNTSLIIPLQGWLCKAPWSRVVYRALSFALALAKVSRSDHGPLVDMSLGPALHFLAFLDVQSRVEFCRGDPRTFHLKPSQMENLHRC